MSGRPLHAVALPAGPALLDALADALDGGPALLPVDPGLPAPALHRLLTALRPHRLVTTDGTRELAGGEPAGDEVSVVIATSGSTGEPKGVELGAPALRHSARATLRRLGARPGDRWLCCLPPSHVAGLQVLVRAMVAGTDPVLVPHFSVAEIAGAGGGAEHISLVPTMLARLLDAGVDLSGFRSVLVGGAAAEAGLLARARAAGARVVTTYGMSETAGGCVYDGVPLDGVSVDLSNDGRVRIAGPVLASGYRMRPDLTAAAFVDGRLLTQDLGRLREGGRLEVLGRVDDVIVTGGVNVSAAAVADLLGRHPDIAEVAVLAAADEQWGQRVVAVVVPREGGDRPTLAALRAHVSRSAPAALAPRELVLVGALPVLPSGKPDRLALADLRRPATTPPG